jgi:membrane peptidoglycan carboxypeptidase
MRRSIYLFLLAVGLPFTFVLLYYWNDVGIARAETAALVQQAFQSHGRALTARDISSQRMDMLLRVEDPTFRFHHGVDLATPGAGMTTISQGIVKLLYFPDGFKPGIGKIRQSLIVQYAFDAQVSKDEQLDLYLNITYFGTAAGTSITGIDRAAQHYFGKSYAALSDDEFLALIGMTISPNTLKPGTAQSKLRVDRIKRYLSGEVKPASVLDVEYTGKTSGSFLDEAFMSLLRVLTDANPK